MMKNNSKKLILMRHADTMPAIGIMSDIERNLSEKGQKQAKRAAKIVNNLSIDKLLISPAKRTSETLDIILSYTEITNIEVIDTIYYGTELDIINIIRDQPDNINNLMILGHNPNIQHLTLNTSLVNNTHYDYLINNSFNPSSIVIIDIVKFDKWSLYKNNSGILTHLYNF